MIGDGRSRDARVVERIASEDFECLVCGEDDRFAAAGETENPIADPKRRGMEIAADSFAPVLFAGGDVVTGDDAAVAPNEEQIAGDDGSRDLRHILLQPVSFLRR